VRLHRNEWTDDLEHIAARTEITACSGDNNGLHLFFLLECLKKIGELAIAFEGERIFSIGPVERDGRDAIFHLETKMARLEGGNR
jgi:hypothetical protein